MYTPWAGNCIWTVFGWDELEAECVTEDNAFVEP